MNKSKHLIPLKYQEALVPFLKQLFTGQHPKLDPTVDKAIPADQFYFLLWKKSGWGLHPDQENKKANGAYQNCRKAVQHMLEVEGVVIVSNSNKEDGETGYYRPTTAAHFEKAAEEAFAMSRYYKNKGDAILKLRDLNLAGPIDKAKRTQDLLKELGL
jgi:hypothetical protein